jgi:hypothetical protein
VAVRAVLVLHTSTPTHPADKLVQLVVLVVVLVRRAVLLLRLLLGVRVLYSTVLLAPQVKQ